MTRKEAIEQLNFMIEIMPKEPPTECDSIEEWLDTDKDIRNALNMAIDALEQEPCEEQEIYEKAYREGYGKGWEDRNFLSRWISVRKMMPEDGQSVLFCDIDNDIMVGYYVKGRFNTHFSQDGTYDDIKNVKAWTPLPKPYYKDF